MYDVYHISYFVFLAAGVNHPFSAVFQSWPDHKKIPGKKKQFFKSESELLCIAVAFHIKYLRVYANASHVLISSIFCFNRYGAW